MATASVATGSEEIRAAAAIAAGKIEDVCEDLQCTTRAFGWLQMICNEARSAIKAGKLERASEWAELGDYLASDWMNNTDNLRSVAHKDAQALRSTAAEAREGVQS